MFWDVKHGILYVLIMTYDYYYDIWYCTSYVLYSQYIRHHAYDIERYHTWTRTGWCVAAQLYCSCRTLLLQQGRNSWRMLFAVYINHLHDFADVLKTLIYMQKGPTYTICKKNMNILVLWVNHPQHQQLLKVFCRLHFVHSSSLPDGAANHALLV